MLNNNKNMIFSSLCLLLLLTPACLGDLMCYVCDDCPQLTKATPLLACNEDFFNQGGSTEASTVTTTTPMSSTTDAATEPITDTTQPESTTMPTTIVVDTTEPEASTSEQPATTEQSTTSTEAPMPTPPTAGPVETTTGLPTPPTEELTKLVAVTDDAPAIRQRRALVDTNVTYHCYKTQQEVNGTSLTQRGCSRVTAMQSVCGELQQQNNGTAFASCDPCSMNACNGANSLLRNSLLATMLLAIVSVVLQSN
ncbi:CG7778 [Drosophila busckii]|uniref:CG7778 n=1 Tax=Drosophila busckii TaxID=30019 RepID=A0A0M3QTH3_DROBS|nr:cell wall integrity and stress response component 4 [Drosophila busckii]ALC38913.1 CG7778 [Drosophila busckii]